jgi:hypothetical protein
MSRSSGRGSNEYVKRKNQIMLINGLKKFAAKAAPTEFEKLTRSGAGIAKSDALNQAQTRRTAKATRKSRNRGKKG